MRVDVLWLLGALRIDYKRVGRMAWGCCPSPAHDDSTPSWRIILDQTDPRYGQHRCYGCNFGGYGIHLVAEVMGLPRQEAREWLVRQGQMGLLPTQIMLQAVGLPAGHRGFALPPGAQTLDDVPYRDWPATAITYLEGRRVTRAQVERWGLAVVPSTAPRPYSGRVVVPVRDQQGRLCNWTARTYTGSPLRYLTPELKDGADLDAVFGQEFWPTEDEGRPVVVVEATFNALAVERVAPEYELAALLGSQIGKIQLLKLSRFKRLLLAFDPDAAGRKASETLELALARSSVCRRVPIPEGHDCDSLEPTELRRLLVEAARGFPATLPAWTN